MSEWRTVEAPAKLNLALVVGPLRSDGKHEVVTVLERLSLHDTVSVRRAGSTRVGGFEDDTLVAAALGALTQTAAGAQPFEARIEKRIPVAAGLGGGSSDAAAALELANDLLDEPLSFEALERLGASLGADVPFFLHRGAQLGTGDGTMLEPLDLPRDYVVVLALTRGAAKASTRNVYAAFDRRGSEHGFDARGTALREALARIRTVTDLALLPSNDLGSSPLADELRELGAFRADVTGAGPVVYGLFTDSAEAVRAAAVVGPRATTWIARPG
jgi:4-diphosphocytidyl-2-C-methyl-D-erythritol kinase